MNKTLILCMISTLFFGETINAKNGYNNDNMSTNGEISFLSRTIKEMDQPVIFDIGANIGIWTKEILKINPNAIVHAFEPNPNSFSKLFNFYSEKANVQCHMVGFSKEECLECIFYTYQNIKESFNVLDGLYNRPILKSLLNGEPKEIHVNITTLDKFCKENEIKVIDLLKIDTEGEEFNILLGALEMLDNYLIKYIQFEYGGCYIDAKTTLESVYNLLTNRGYSIYRLIPSGLKHINVWDSSLENYQLSNYVAIKNEF